MNSTQITLTTTPTVIVASTPAATRTIYIHPGANDILIGGSNITAANGLPLEKNVVTQIEIPPQNALYGITVSGSHAINVLTPSGDF